jgi:protein O-GlcNAc transferase
LQAMRRRLIENRASRPLFDIDRLRRHVEAAYRNMWDIYANGERPRHFTI